MPMVIPESVHLSTTASDPWHALAADYVMVLENGVAGLGKFDSLVVVVTIVPIKPI